MVKIAGGEFIHIPVKGNDPVIALENRHQVLKLAVARHDLSVLNFCLQIVRHFFLIFLHPVNCDCRIAVDRQRLSAEIRRAEGCFGKRRRICAGNHRVDGFAPFFGAVAVGKTVELDARVFDRDGFQRIVKRLRFADIVIALEHIIHRLGEIVVAR